MKTEHNIFMGRCLYLARLGLGKVSPNPLVAAVIVKDGRIIGEGYHRKYGAAHAEVEAIKSVKDRSQLRSSTIYVNLEPCSHHGKTPPCTDLIIKSGIPSVVIGMTDPNKEVNGSGVQKLKDAGIKVITDIRKVECEHLNKRFICQHSNGRPYIILKWAESADGFIGKKNNTKINWISNPLSRKLVHKWRADEDSIMVGTNTAVQDNPSLNTRDWSGDDPVRLFIDFNNKINRDCHLFDNSATTYIVGGPNTKKHDGLKSISVRSKKTVPMSVLKELQKEGIQSLIVEGGKMLLDSFIDAGLWDEARIFRSSALLEDGIAAPEISGTMIQRSVLGADNLIILSR